MNIIMNLMKIISTVTHESLSGRTVAIMIFDTHRKLTHVHLNYYIICAGTTIDVSKIK